MRRVIVTGGRDWDNEEYLFAVLDTILSTEGSDMVIVHGANPRGADALADKWAQSRGVLVERHPANWNEHGRAAGPIRNEIMVRLGADEVVAFPGPGSRGTWDCIRRARLAHIRVGVHGPHATDHHI